MPHVPESTIHFHVGRRVVIRTEPIPSVTEADLTGVTFIVKGRLEVAASFEDKADGLVVTVTLTQANTSTIGVGRHRWQLLPEDAAGRGIEPLAVGKLRVSTVYAGPTSP